MRGGIARGICCFSSEQQIPRRQALEERQEDFAGAEDCL
jgi:hypothetical protein